VDNLLVNDDYKLTMISMRPELWFPVKPWVITQAWGIYNPAYLQFGFTKHNGIDVLEGKDRTVYCPIKNLYIYDTGYGESTGYRVKGYALDPYTFPDGVEALVDVIVMHGEKTLCKVGDILQVGDKMMISDHTGFSTGPHVHFMTRRLHPLNYQILDKNEANDTFDPKPYFNGFYAKDATFVMNTYATLIKVLASMRDLLLKK